MRCGALIIGDEIINGKRQDKHFARVIATLKQRGMELTWCHYLGDDRARLTDFLRRSFASADLVFSFGGIGATPDDHTRQAAAAALGVELELHPDAEREIRTRFGGETLPRQLSLGEFPRGAEIIPNPYNRMPGFALRCYPGEHYFLPGFPAMAWPMLEWVLDTHYLHLQHATPKLEQALIVYDATEGVLIDFMETLTAQYPQARLFCLPTLIEEGKRRQLELGMRGEPQQVRAAMQAIRQELSARNYPFEEKL